jgi:hypothetical protein
VFSRLNCQPVAGGGGVGEQDENPKILLKMRNNGIFIVLRGYAVPKKSRMGY